MAPRNREDVIACLKENNYKVNPTARALRACKKTVRRILSSIDSFDMEGSIDDSERTVEELLDARKAEFNRKRIYEEDNLSRLVRVNADGPIGIAHFGDPHVDDPGTDIALLQRHMEIVRDTPGMYAANVGDLQNNWVGRLSQLYSRHTITAKESTKLVEWMFNFPVDNTTGQNKWLYVVGGNHDAWSGERDLLEWFAKQGSVLFRYHGIRIKLVFPNKREVRVNTRHDFKGNSMWNVAHAAMRAAQISFKDHIFTCGHRHVSGYGIVVNPDPENPVISHCLRISAYKKYDEYASKIGATPHDISPCAVTIIDQHAEHERDLVTVIWSPENAADYLTWLRAKRKGRVTIPPKKNKNGNGSPLGRDVGEAPLEYELEEYNLMVKPSTKSKSTGKATPQFKGM